MRHFFPRNYQGFRYHPSGDFFVPQRLTPESGDLLSESMIQAKESTKSLEIWDVLGAMPTDSSARCIAVIVIGSPGSGKNHFVRVFYNEFMQKIATNRYIPGCLT